MSTLSYERTQDLVKAAHRQRNAAMWNALATLFAALKARPKLRESRWLAANRGW